MHNMPVEPTPDTLSLYTVFMCHYIKPDSIDTYLSGIFHQLEPYFPNVQEICKSRLVHCTLEGCIRAMQIAGNGGLESENTQIFEGEQMGLSFNF